MSARALLAHHQIYSTTERNHCLDQTSECCQIYPKVYPGLDPLPWGWWNAGTCCPER